MRRASFLMALLAAPVFADEPKQQPIDSAVADAAIKRCLAHADAGTRQSVQDAATIATLQKRVAELEAEKAKAEKK